MNINTESGVKEHAINLLAGARCLLVALVGVLIGYLSIPSGSNPILAPHASLLLLAITTIVFMTWALQALRFGKRNQLHSRLTFLATLILITSYPLALGGIHKQHEGKVAKSETRR